MTVRVLADFHHHDLYESLAILLEDRFGWELFRPVGLEWFDDWYWNFERAYHGDAVARQYLPQRDDDAQGPGYSTRADPSHPGRLYRLLTVEQARAANLDLVVSTVDHNHVGFARFAGEVGATFGIQVGNRRDPWDANLDHWDLAAFGLVSSALPYPVTKPHVVYHQEFSLRDFAYVPPPRGETFRLRSFVQCFAENVQEYALFRATAAAAPELGWDVFGSYCSAEPDEYARGLLQPCAEVARGMQGADVVWHSKKWSDGYGHVIHNAFAVGRPVVGSEGYYRSQLAGPLWVDGVTSIDTDRRSRAEVLEEVRRLWRDEERHVGMAEAAAARFRDVVSFDEEADKIAAMLEGFVR